MSERNIRAIGTIPNNTVAFQLNADPSTIRRWSSKFEEAGIPFYKKGGLTGNRLYTQEDLEMFREYLKRMEQYETNDAYMTITDAKAKAFDEVVDLYIHPEVKAFKRKKKRNGKEIYEFAQTLLIEELTFWETEEGKERIKEIEEKKEEESVASSISQETTLPALPEDLNALVNTVAAQRDKEVAALLRQFQEREQIFRSYIEFQQTEKEELKAFIQEQKEDFKSFIEKQKEEEPTTIRSAAKSLGKAVTNTLTGKNRKNKKQG